MSYRRTDSKHIACHIYERLQQHFGTESVFMDMDDIPSGIEFRSYLQEEIGKCSIVAAIIGEQWLECRHAHGPKRGQRRIDDPDDFVRIEIEFALTHGIPVVPVLIDGVRMPAQEELPEGLRGLGYRQATEVRSGRDFGNHVARLASGIEALLRPKEEEARRLAEEMRIAREQEEERRAAAVKRLELEREEARRQAETERLRREQAQAEAERLRNDMSCPKCGTLNPTRCASCGRCFTCHGDKPHWWTKIMFGDGYNCSECSGLNHAEYWAS